MSQTKIAYFKKRKQLTESQINIPITIAQKNDKPKPFTTRDRKQNVSCVGIPKLRQTGSTISSSGFWSYPKRTIHNFKKLKSLGQGKCGEVFLAIDRKSGFIGALKIINKENLNRDKKMKEQLIQQIKIQSYLHHKNIVSLYTFFDDAKSFCLFMQLGCNGQLYEIMERGKTFHEETISYIIRELLEGLNYLHNEDIIHRDLKPQNIVVVHGVPKICDFGWSAYCPKKFRETFCGTPLYLSPQILSGRLYNDKIDTWAIGALTFELFTGQNPFKIKTQQQLSKIITEEFEMNIGSKDLREFVKRALRKNPSERPQAKLLRKLPFIKKYQKLETSEELCLRS